MQVPSIAITGDWSLTRLRHLSKSFLATKSVFLYQRAYKNLKYLRTKIYDKNST